MTAVFRWEEPPDVPRPSGPEPGSSWTQGAWREHLRPCVEHPGEWALLAVFDAETKARGCKSNFNGRKVNIPQPDESWDFCQRRTGEHEWSVYGRYLGE